MEIHIRPIRLEDNAILAKIVKDTFYEFDLPKVGTVYSDPSTDALFELFSATGSAYLVAEMNGKVVGGCGIFPTEGLPATYVELVKFYLAPDARGNGIGKMLMVASEKLATLNGYTHLYLESFPNLSRAIEMYNQSGFSFLQHAMGNSGHSACNVWMLKKL